MPALVPMSRVRELAARGRTAMVVGTQAFDFTDFQDLHPGGKDYLLAQKGKVATAPFTSSHPLDIIVATLSKAQLAAMLLGDIDAATIEPSDHPAAAAAAASAAAAAPAASHHASPSGAGAAALPPGPKPTLDSCLNIYDFEAIAAASLSEQALAYYSSGGDDEITLRENHSAFHRLWMRPRVMVNVKAIDMSTTLLGARCALPLFLSAVAMCKMGHPEGEAAWMRAAGRAGVVYMVPTLSGCSFGEIMGARATPAQPEPPAATHAFTWLTTPPTAASARLHTSLTSRLRCMPSSCRGGRGRAAGDAAGAEGAAAPPPPLLLLLLLLLLLMLLLVAVMTTRGATCRLHVAGMRTRLGKVSDTAVALGSTAAQAGGSKGCARGCACACAAAAAAAPALHSCPCALLCHACTAPASSGRRAQA